MSQKAIVNLLKVAWTFAQEVCERMSVSIEWQLTIPGLTAHAADALCSRA